MTRKTAIVICPGRGTYNAAELGYLKTHHSDKANFIAMIDAARSKDQMPISALDGAEKFSPSVHLPGDNASLLIYACALADYQSISSDYDIVGVTGNSLGWYMALACAGAVSLSGGARIVNTTGGLMHDHAGGGQVVYSMLDSDWRIDRAKQALVEDILAHPVGMITTSIRLGGMVVFAADETGLSHLMKTLPKDGNFPFKINYHAAFHSAMMEPISVMAKGGLSRDLFSNLSIPMIDGRGKIWMPHASDLTALYDYTLGHQITQTYDFTRVVQVAAKEFAPDVFIVLGPGTTMGAPVAQSLIAQNTRGLSSKTQFQTANKDAPYIISMGMDGQRRFATNP